MIALIFIKLNSTTKGCD